MSSDEIRLCRVRAGVVAAAAVLLAGTATTAAACPVCDTDTGLAVRAGIFNDGFWMTMLHALAPFPVLAAMVAAVHLGNRDPHEKPRARDTRRGPS